MFITTFVKCYCTRSSNLEKLEAPASMLRTSMISYGSHGFDAISSRHFMQSLKYLPVIPKDKTRQTSSPERTNRTLGHWTFSSVALLMCTFLKYVHNC